MSISRLIADLPTVTAANTRHTIKGELLKPARRLVLEEHPEGTYIFRYADDWSFGGDTWHANIDEARDQIGFEYEVNDLNWKPISEEALIALTNPK
jgi:hypothetical protein